MSKQVVDKARSHTGGVNALPPNFTMVPKTWLPPDVKHIQTNSICFSRQSLLTTRSEPTPTFVRLVASILQRA